MTRSEAPRHVAYFDHAATTQVHPSVVDVMMRCYSDTFGNPSGGHTVARAARRAIDEARDAVASIVGCAPREVIFTSGGTEADNLAIFGTPGHAVTVATEHHAVLHAVEHVGGSIAGVLSTGEVDLDSLSAVCTTNTRMVSVMLANNEAGTINDLDAVRRTIKKCAPNASLHTDAVQAAAWLDLREAARSADMISMSAHKFGGPKGVGVLVARSGHDPQAQLVGGGQERELRSGTQNVAGIVGLAEALRITDRDRAVTNARVATLRDRLADGLTQIANVHETVERSKKLPGSCHLCIEDVEGESMLFLLERQGIYASAASSCASGAMEPSHVLAAMGVPIGRASGALRLTLGVTTSNADVDHALAVIPDVINRLRAR